MADGFLAGRRFALRVPACRYCGEDLIGRLPVPAWWCIPGQWLYSEAHGYALFVIHPTTRVEVTTLPNGQMALFADDVEGGPSMHYCEGCMKLLNEEDRYENDADDEDGDNVLMDPDEQENL